MSWRGVVRHGVIELLDGVILPEWMEVEVTPLEVQSEEPLSDFLMRFAGTIDGLPEDMAKNHDHYIHGTPKK